MRTLFQPLMESAQFRKAVSCLVEPAGHVLADGCADSQKVHFAYALAESETIAPNARVRLFVTYSDLRAREILDDCRFYDRDAVLFPAKDLIFYQADLRGRELEAQRLRCLRRMTEGKQVTVVTTFSALMTPQVPLRVLKENVLTLSRNETIHLDTIADRLTAMGYERNYQVDSPGQFSIRGDIIDVYDLTEENPVRIELWGDDIDSIRSFDILSQRSIEELESVRLYPATEIILSSARLSDGIRRIRAEEEKRYQELREARKTEEAARLKKEVLGICEQAEQTRDLGGMEGFLRYFYPAASGFLDLCPQDTLALLDEPAHLHEQAEAIGAEFRESMVQRVEKGYILPGQMDLLVPEQEVLTGLMRLRRAALCTLGTPSELFPLNAVHLRARTVAPYNNSFEALLRDLSKYRKDRARVLILSGSRTRAKRLAKELTDQGATAFYSEDPERELRPGEVEVFYGHSAHGFEYPELKFTVIADTDIFGAEQTKVRKKKPRHTGAGAIRSLDDLHVGDYVVHEDHGVGIYRGIEKIEVDHIAKDYIKIEYGSGDFLYVLPNDLSVLQKYAAGGDAKPKLNRLGTQEWSNTRRKVQKAVDEVAQDLVELYAKRQSERGHAFSPDTPWQREFEEMFPYQETQDQLAAIEDTKRDMESGKIMDRLVCGDVGYGKTEIAIRAAFKAAQDGYQTAVLVPTTILAQQHFNTFSERMHGYPVNIGQLSRFVSPAEQKRVLGGLADGSVDIVIGTHRLLSQDVHFHKLGLLVVDEEQRFGVTHKEKIKKMRENVDVLTLTATPIPRTLHMSLVGIRDMSLLEEAPGERQPIQTYVMEYNEEMIREAIVRELARGGQVYYVYNRVNDIDRITDRIRKLVPQARVAFAHGQMEEKQLEQIMIDFVNREIDVLVSTTIIETGLDISNVNTIIIHDADRLGLSQLYQLRGRVGRSSRTAYAFLMYQKDRMLKEDAEKRLAAIREFTELGSGYRIAMRDLEIRGAGSVLGRAQHGHMAKVGYDLYCRMLETAVRKAKGIPAQEEPHTEVKLNVDAYIPETYIVNETQKLEIYRRIADIASVEDYQDRRDELLDRFGQIPMPAQNLLRIALIRAAAQSLDLASIVGYAGKIILKPQPKADWRVENIPALLRRFRPNLTFLAKGEPQFEYTFRPAGVTEKDEETLLGTTEDILTAMGELLKRNHPEA